MAKEPIDRTALRTALAVLVGGVAVILDSTIVSVALQQLAIDLDVGIDVIQWVSTIYLLALGVAIPLVGWLQGRLGSKRLWMIALALFLVGSVLCACAWDATSLIAFRAVQGLGGGALLPLMMTMVMQSARGGDAARIMSVVALPAAVGPILGPVIGGLILGVGDWRWLFLVNVPLCLAGLVLAWLLIPAERATRRVRLDIVGLVLLSPALVALLWGLSNVSGDGGFGHPDVLVPMIGGAVLLVGFVLWAVHRGSTALVDVAVLRSRPTWSATALMFLSGASLYGAMFLLPLYFQQMRGTDALGAGLLLIPQGVGSLLSRTVAMRMMERVGARGIAVIGFVLAAIGSIPFVFVGADTTMWPLLIALFVRGLGIGMVMIPLMTVAFVGLAKDDVPHASILTRIAQQIGGSVGVALLAVVLAGTQAATGSATTAFDTAFWWTVGLTVVALALTVALPSRDRVAAVAARAEAQASAHETEPHAEADAEAAAAEV